MKRTVIALLIGLLALSSVVGIGLAQAGKGGANQSVEQEDDDDGREDDFPPPTKPTKPGGGRRGTTSAGDVGDDAHKPGARRLHRDQP